MKFREWLHLEMAMVSKQPIDISAPEVIERLKNEPVSHQFPYWTNALAKILIEIQQHTQEGETADQAVHSLMKRTRKAGIDPLQTRQINFSPNEQAVKYRAVRYMRKWIYQSISLKETGKLLPNNFFNKKYEINDPTSKLGASLYKTARESFSIEMLQPNVNIGWNPNSMVPDENSYDDKNLEANQLKQISSKLGMTNNQLKKFIKDKTTILMQNFIANGKVRKDINLPTIIKNVWDKFIMNLMRFNPAHPSPIAVTTRSLQNFIRNTTWGFARKSENRPSVQIQQKPKINPYLQPNPELAAAAG